jgi:ribosomal protein L19E
MMKVALHPLGGKEVAAKSDDDIKKLIMDGKGKMKPVAGVSEVQASDIVAFVRTLK